MNIEEIKEKINKSKENHRYNITSSREWFENLLDYITNLQQENKQLKEELQQFQSDFEKEEAEVFNELEQAINKQVEELGWLGDKENE